MSALDAIFGIFAGSRAVCSRGLSKQVSSSARERRHAGHARAKRGVTMAPVPRLRVVATINRRVATMQPQVDGLTEINASGTMSKSGQVLMSIDPLHQQASVDFLPATGRENQSSTTTVGDRSAEKLLRRAS